MTCATWLAPRAACSVAGLALAPDGEIDRCIASVVEAVFAEARRQRIGLGGAGYVLPAIAGDHLVEQAHMTRHRFGDSGIGGAAQHDRPAAVLFTQPAEQRLVVGQVGGVRNGAACDLALETGLASEEPEWQHEQVQRIAPQQHRQRFVQGVTEDQRPVQIDSQRWQDGSAHGFTILAAW